jgi:hypothetical protein
MGISCREAVQEFASALVARYDPPDVDPSPQATKNRIRAVIRQHGAGLGDRRTALLNAVVTYWSAVIDVVQRQEHSGEPGNESATWEDARSAVLHTAMLMSEIAIALP